MSSIGIGIGAGLVSALLFGVVITGSPLAMLLSYLAPLPILIAALGWRHRAGLVATLAGGIATALAFRPEAGLAFAFGSGLPGWWIAYLALLGRPREDGAMEWYPLGRLLLWIAVLAAFVTVAGVMALGDGDYEGYRTGLRRALETVLPATNPEQAPARGALLEALVTAVPVVAAAVFVLVFVLNLWIAARTVRISERLPRPWPAIAATVMPRQALLIFAGAAGLCFLPGFVGTAGLSVVGALVIAFALQGLGLLHEATRGRNGRVGILTVTYILIAFVGHTVLPLFALVGMADSALPLRARFRPGSAGPGSPSP
ncbi:MAG TPA: DUF2232 domain-containing protein [Microvirga sp.]|jgi:hypothetical protein|nr:DUF2232 domain-containing protein [Microvirga sp.]